MASIEGREIVPGTRVKTWFMPGGTIALEGIHDYHGPLAALWPKGARIIGFAAMTRSGCLSMTVGNDDLFEVP